MMEKMLWQKRCYVLEKMLCGGKDIMWQKRCYVMGKMLSDGKDVVAEKMLFCWQRRCYVMGKMLSDGKDVVVEKMLRYYVVESMLYGEKDFPLLDVMWWKGFPITPKCLLIIGLFTSNSL